MHGDQLSVVQVVDQFVVGGRYGFGQVAMVEHCDVVAFHEGAEARLRGSPHQNAITGRQLGVLGEKHINGRVAVLHKQFSCVAAEVSNRGLEGYRQRMTGLGVGEGVNGAQRGQRGGRGGPCSRGASENDRNCENQSFHRENPVVSGVVWPLKVLIGRAGQRNHLRVKKKFTPFEGAMSGCVLVPAVMEWA